MALSFEWDRAKDAANRRKHRVSFDEACTVFGDPLGWFQPDPAHSDREARFLLLGRSSADRLLAVLFAERGPDVVRIISARPATARERTKYAEDLR